MTSDSVDAVMMARKQWLALLLVIPYSLGLPLLTLVTSFTTGGNFGSLRPRRCCVAVGRSDSRFYLGKEIADNIGNLLSLASVEFPPVESKSSAQ
jgi:hypothetical protein